MKKSVAILLVLALVFSFSISAIAESVTSADASSMRLVRTEGIVFLTDDSGSPLSIRENMRLYSGNTVETASDSRAGISLDKAKTVTLDEDSAASLHSEGKNLSLNLESGAMYFSVSKPLEADENFEIRTSTMVLGIRGTSGYVAAVNDSESIVILTSGHALITAVTGDEQEIAAGQCVTIRLEESGTEFTVSSVTPYDLPSFLLAELAADSAMLAEADSQIGNHFRQTVLELLSPSSAVHSSSSAASICDIAADTCAYRRSPSGVSCTPLLFLIKSMLFTCCSKLFMARVTFGWLFPSALAAFVKLQYFAT